MQIYNILKDADGRELTKHGDSGFPCAGYDEVFSEYTHGEVPWHWHEEIELAIIYEGSTKVYYAGGEIILNTGDGIFINANILHKLTRESEQECRMFTFVLKPELLGGRIDSRIYRDYIAPICTNNALPVIIFSPTEEWQENILYEIRTASENYTLANKGYEMQVLTHLIEFWRLLYINRSDLTKNNLINSIDERRIRDILQFIQDNYMSKISVSDISKIAGISESECYRLFNRVLKFSPGEYLMEYRLRKASEKLINSTESILNIALDTGFNSSAYFTKRFKEYYKIAPSKFRRIDN